MNVMSAQQALPSLPARERLDFRNPETQPLVSVLMFVRNGMPHLRRAVQSVLSQSHANLEFIIQDGASTDGTVAYLQSLTDPRIKLVSEPDDGPADGFARAMSRCNGDIIGTCLADEEIVPGALNRIVELFDLHPHLGAITGDAHITDIEGNITSKFVGAPFNIVTYLFGEYCPYWCSSFFKAEALRFVGIFDNRWSRSSLEFEIWCRLAIETDIHYVPEIFSKYAHHADQLSQNPARVEDEIDARLSIIRNQLFGPGTFFGDDDFRRDVICLLQLRNLYLHLTNWNPTAADRILDQIAAYGYLGHFNSSRAALKGSLDDKERAKPNSDLSRRKRAEQDTGKSVLLTAAPGLDFVKGVASEPSRQMSILGVPMDEYLIKQQSGLGLIYRSLLPRNVRGLIPRNLKIAIVHSLGLRKRTL